MNRFWSKVNIGAIDECWEWIASKDTGGYGHLKCNGVMKRAHRCSWELVNGNIPYGLFVLHKCDNRACVNPKHLKLGTHKHNMDDMVEKDRTIGGYGRKQYIVVFPDGRKEVVNNMNQFCKQYGLEQRNMLAVLKGKKKTHRGYSASYIPTQS